MASFDIQASIRGRLETSSGPSPTAPLPRPVAAPTKAASQGVPPTQPESSPRAISKDRDSDSETPRPKVHAVPNIKGRKGGNGVVGKGKGRSKGRGGKGRGGKGRGRKGKTAAVPEEEKTADAEGEGPEEGEKDAAADEGPQEGEQDDDAAAADEGPEVNECNDASDEGEEDEEELVEDDEEFPEEKEASENVHDPKRGSMKKPAASGVMKKPAASGVKAPESKAEMKRPSAALGLDTKKKRQRKGETTKESWSTKSGWKAGWVQFL